MFRTPEGPRDFRRERDELEPVLADESFEFLDDESRLYRVVARGSGWTLYYRNENGHWRLLRPLTAGEVVRLRWRASPSQGEAEPAPVRAGGGP